LGRCGGIFGRMKKASYQFLKSGSSCIWMF
jgi:hypothetical protein